MYPYPYSGGQTLHTGLPSLVITNLSPCWTSFMILRHRRRAWLLLMTSSIQSPKEQSTNKVLVCLPASFLQSSAAFEQRRNVSRNVPKMDH